MKDKHSWLLFRGFKKDENGKIRFLTLGLSGRLSSVGRRSKVLRALSRVEESMAYSSAKAYGTVLLVWGLLSILIQIVKSSLGFGDNSVFANLIVGAAIAALSTPLMITDKPFCLIFNETPVLDYIIFEFFRIKRMPKSNVIKTPVIYSIVTGLLLALFTIPLPTWSIAAAVAILVFLYVSLISPEFAFFSTILALPSISILDFSSVIVSILIAISALSLTRKIIFGKRTLFFEQYDAIISLLIAIVLMNAIFPLSLDSVGAALITAITLLAYFCASNIITNRRLAECALYAISLSSLPVSIIAILQFIVKIGREGAEFLQLGISSTLNGSGAFCAYISAAVITSFTISYNKRKRNHGFVYFAVGLLGIIALALAARIDAVIILAIAGIILSLALKSKKKLILTIVVYILAHVPLLLPEGLLNLISAINPNVYGNITEWRGVARVVVEDILRHPLFGIVNGEDTFFSVSEGIFGKGYANAGVLIVQLAAELGILFVIALALLLIVRLRHVTVYSTYTSLTKLDEISLPVNTSVFVMITLGAFSHTFSDTAAVVLFFTILGIGSALLRISRSDYDAKYVYDDSETNVKSYIDVEISKSSRK